MKAALETSLRVKALRFAGSRLGFAAAALFLLLVPYLSTGNIGWTLPIALIGSWVLRRWVDARLDRVYWRSRRALERAEECVEERPEKALTLVQGAIADGVEDDRLVLAWVLAARAYELAGAIDEADRAVAMATQRAARRSVDPALWLRATLQSAFIKAALGELDAAEECLRGVERRHAAKASLASDFVKARAMLAYRRAEYGQAIDIATEALSGEAALARRDRVLLEALRQSSFLRLGGGGPMRAASEARAAEDDAAVEEEWAHAIVRRARTQRA